MLSVKCVKHCLISILIQLCGHFNTLPSQYQGLLGAVGARSQLQYLSDLCASSPRTAQEVCIRLRLVRFLSCRTRTNFGDRAFSTAGPRVWNYLPADLRQPDLSYSRYRQSLKTFLFGRRDQSTVSISYLTALKKSSCLLTYLLTYLFLLTFLLWAKQQTEFITQVNDNVGNNVFFHLYSGVQTNSKNSLTVSPRETYRGSCRIFYRNIWKKKKKSHRKYSSLRNVGGNTIIITGRFSSIDQATVLHLNWWGIFLRKILRVNHHLHLICPLPSILVCMYPSSFGVTRN